MDMKDKIDAIMLALLGPRPPWGDHDLPTFAGQTVLAPDPVAAMLGERGFRGDGFFGFVAVHLPSSPIPAPREGFTLRWSP